MVDIEFTDSDEAEEIRIRHLEEVNWVESTKAQVVDNNVEIQTYFVDRGYIKNREVTIVKLEDVEDIAEAETRLKTGLKMMFGDNFVGKELVEERGLIAELAEQALNC